MRSTIEQENGMRTNQRAIKMITDLKIIEVPWLQLMLVASKWISNGWQSINFAVIWMPKLWKFKVCTNSFLVWSISHLISSSIFEISQTARVDQTASSHCFHRILLYPLFHLYVCGCSFFWHSVGDALKCFWFIAHRFFYDCWKEILWLEWYFFALIITRVDFFGKYICHDVTRTLWHNFIISLA